MPINFECARKAADDAEKKCTEMERCVAEMQRLRDHYKNEMKMSRYYVESEAEAEGNFVMYNRLLSEASVKWSGALLSQGELWQKYCDLLEDYEEKEKNAERPDEKCSFCGMMHSECGGDHGDEMRQIIRENSPWRR
jgi:hypothetical protein